MGIKVHRLTRRFGDFAAVDDVSFEVKTGELVALLGPSGGGKSTILRIVAGLETADSGSVSLDGESVDELPARDRQVGFVFQHYALFRHMTVADNIGYGLKVRGVPKEERRARTAELLRIMLFKVSGGIGADGILETIAAIGFRQFGNELLQPLHGFFIPSAGFVSGQLGDRYLRAETGVVPMVLPEPFGEGYRFLR